MALFGKKASRDDVFALIDAFARDDEVRIDRYAGIVGEARNGPMVVLEALELIGGILERADDVDRRDLTVREWVPVARGQQRPQAASFQRAMGLGLFLGEEDESGLAAMSQLTDEEKSDVFLNLVYAAGRIVDALGIELRFGGGTSAPAALAAAPAGQPPPPLQPVSQPPPPPQPVGQWAPDPWGRHELRYHDGVNWTMAVANGGVQSTDA